MHPGHLGRTLHKCREVNLKLHPKKGFFAVHEGILLGHKISKHGIEVDMAKSEFGWTLSFQLTRQWSKSSLGVSNTLNGSLWILLK